MDSKTYLIIDEDVLPEVFQKVMLANSYLKSGEASTTSEAVRLAGISRSVFYKYKDAVFPYQKNDNKSILTVQVVLMDKPGVLVNLLSHFHQANANILTVNQNIPVKGRAFVSVSARIDHLDRSSDNFIEELREVTGVLKIDSISE